MLRGKKHIEVESAPSSKYLEKQPHQRAEMFAQLGEEMSLSNSSQQALEGELQKIAIEYKGICHDYKSIDAQLNKIKNKLW